MHLVSCCDQTVRVAGHVIRFERGETIHTENSYKYRAGAFCRDGAIRPAGTVSSYGPIRQQLFSLHLLEPRRGP